jgi:hypothetical protein
MTDEQPLVRAVEAEVIANEDELRRVHRTTPDEWRAVRIDEYPGGADAVAVMPPDDLPLTDVRFERDAHWVPDPEIVPVLLPEVEREVEVRYASADGESDVVELWIEDPPRL